MNDSKHSLLLNQKAFLGKAAQDLLNLSSDQVAAVYEQRGLKIPVEVSSTLLYLHQHEDLVLTDISKALSLPHQVAAQRVAKLEGLKLLEKNPDPSDRRRSFLHLTRAGRAQAKRLDQCMADMALVYQELYQEIKCDLPKKLSEAIDSLKRRDLASRFETIFNGSKI